MSKKLVYTLLVCLALSVLLASAAQAKPPKPPTIEQRVAALEAQVAVLTAQLQAAQSVLALAPYVKVTTAPMNDVAGPNIVLWGANVHVLNGTTSTGLGNLIVGSNDVLDAPEEGYRSGSDNLVVGNWNSFPGTGCFVAGQYNVASGPNASVSGGYFNAATDMAASVSGGGRNVASGEAASVSGGRDNEASGSMASVSGGLENLASGGKASVSGGQLNKASAEDASVSGGIQNEASGDEASVSGGKLNKASDHFASVSGGIRNEASGDGGSVSGGTDILWSAIYGWAAGVPESSTWFHSP